VGAEQLDADDAGKIVLPEGTGRPAFAGCTLNINGGCMFHRLLVIPILLSFAATLFAQQKAEDRLRPPADPRARNIRTLFHGSGFVPPTDKSKWEARAKELRQQILIAAGLWPMPEKTPLNAVIHGRIERDDYTVEKVFFESHPGFYVTGNLYRPKGKTGPFPAVLCPHGHWANGRFNETSEKEVEQQLKAGHEVDRDAAKYVLQARCANLAKLGCVVFHYDMVGYADADPERFPHRKTFTDVEADLNIQSIFGLQTWDSIRALDFVVSLPDVDKDRIAATGASGGGTQTFILMAIDDRLKVAAPVCMISAGDHQGGCVCENNSLLRMNTDNVEISATFAPRPFIHPTTMGDWTKEYLEKGLPETKAVYKLFGAEQNVQAMRQNAGHNYNLHSREAVYNFFNKHLKLGAAEPVKEQEFKPIPPKELSVFTAEYPRPSNSIDTPGLRKYLTESAAKQMQALRPTDAASLAKFGQVIQPALRHMLSTSLPSASQIKVEKVVAPFAHVVEKLVVSRTVGAEKLPVLVFHSPKPNRAITILIHPNGKSALHEPDGGPGSLATSLLVKGHTVMAPDIFLTGELAGVNPIAASKVEFFAGYNRTVLANRIHDILTVIATAKATSQDAQVNVVGIGKAGPWVMVARALAGDGVFRTVADASMFDFQNVKANTDENYLPASLRYGGLYNLTALSAPGELFIYNTGPADTAPLISAYKAASAEANVKIQAGEADFVTWLTR
jgi:dienelactone hydrolase